MDPNTFPTKGNLILAKNSLALSRQGYELMDKKRNILIREMMNLVDQAKDIQGQIDETFRTAYEALQKANMEEQRQSKAMREVRRLLSMDLQKISALKYMDA